MICPHCKEKIIPKSFDEAFYFADIEARDFLKWFFNQEKHSEILIAYQKHLESE